MATLPIIVAPDPRLKAISAPVEKVDRRVRKLMDDMLESMYGAPGVGLSAVQIGVAQRIIVIDVAKDPAPPAPHPGQTAHAVLADHPHQPIRPARYRHQTTP